MKKFGFTLTEALVTLIVMGLVTIAGLNIVGGHIKSTKGGSSIVGGGGCPWEVVCSNDEALLSKNKNIVKCTEYDNKFDVDHIYYMTAKKADKEKDPAFIVGMVGTYTHLSMYSAGSKLSAGDAWEDFSVSSQGTKIRMAAASIEYRPWWHENLREHGLSVYPEADFSRYSVVGDAIRDGVDVYGKGKWASMPMAGYAHYGTTSGYTGGPNSTKNYDEALLTIYQQAFFCNGINVANSSNKTNDNQDGGKDNTQISREAQEEAQSVVDEFDEDWSLLKKWFSIGKLKEVVAMNDNDENKVIKSNETLLDVIASLLKRVAALEARETQDGQRNIDSANGETENGNWQIVCEGASCANYKERFSFDYQYMFDISGTSGRGQFTATLLQNGNNAPFLVAEVQDAADYFVYQDNGLKACHAWFTDGSGGSKRSNLGFNKTCSSAPISINAVYERKIR